METAMKDTPAYKGLEELLENERAGSPKIRALAHWLMQEDIRSKLEQPLSPSQERQCITQQAYVEYLIFAEGYTADAAEYLTAFEEGFASLQPYIDTFRDEGKLNTLLLYLREINREKSVLARKRVLETKRAWEEYR